MNTTYNRIYKLISSGDEELAYLGHSILKHLSESEIVAFFKEYHNLVLAPALYDGARKRYMRPLYRIDVGDRITYTIKWTFGEYEVCQYATCILYTTIKNSKDE